MAGGTVDVSQEIRRVREHYDRAGVRVGLEHLHDRLGPGLIGFLYDGALPRVSPAAEAGGFMNYGYWVPGAGYREASEQLMERLIAELPRRAGTILDVACGTGATSRYLSRYWDPQCIYGINVSERQLAECRRGVPRAHFARMDAAAMSFNDESFGNVVCVEAAFHFETRQAFLNEVFRILRPGGRLVLTDVLLHEEGHALLPLWRRSNYVPSLGAYEAVVRAAGFSHVQVIDITEEGWRSFARCSVARLHESWMANRCGFNELQDELRTIYSIQVALKSNCVCVAEKP